MTWYRPHQLRTRLSVLVAGIPKTLVFRDRQALIDALTRTRAGAYTIRSAWCTIRNEASSPNEHQRGATRDALGIFPLTQLGPRLMGRPGKVTHENRLWGLGAQSAFTVPLNFLLVGAATLYRESWCFPATMIVVGSHHLPFITLYGVKLSGGLAALLVLTGATLIAFTFAGRAVVLREENRSRDRV